MLPAEQETMILRTAMHGLLACLFAALAPAATPAPGGDAGTQAAEFARGFLRVLARKEAADVQRMLHPSVRLEYLSPEDKNALVEILMEGKMTATQYIFRLTGHNVRNLLIPAGESLLNESYTMVSYRFLGPVQAREEREGEFPLYWYVNVSIRLRVVTYDGESANIIMERDRSPVGEVSVARDSGGQFRIIGFVL
jgi:hypothetical protein